MRFRDPDLPLGERVDDLLGRLTLDEKVRMMHQHQPEIPRLGLRAFHTGREALHGLAWCGVAAVFPQAIGLASTWDPGLVRRVGSATGDEVRGRDHDDPSTGLNVWAPVVNLLRNPLWGRNEEGYSEDPLLTAVMSVAYCEGLRGDDPRYLKTAPSLKHFLAYNREDERDTTSISLPPRVQWEYELPAFRAAIEAGVATGVMGSYNLVNARPAHLSPLINEVVRSWSDDELMVVSDAFAPSNVVRWQHYYDDHATSHAAMVRAGIDSFTDQGPDAALTVGALREALARGLLDEADLDIALRRVLSIRLRLGEFDPPGRNPYERLTSAVIDSPEHRALAREAARAAIVLLKNDGLLPLRAEAVRRVAVIGPHADLLYEDWYSGTMPYRMTPVAGIRERLAGQAEIVCVEGVDRVAFELVATGDWMAASSDVEGAALAVGGAAGHAFDLFDWGEGLCTLRAVANGRLVSAKRSGRLVNDCVEPREWVVTETFRLVPEGDHVLIQNAASGRYVIVSGDGALTASAAAVGDASRFRVHRLSVGITDAAGAALGADAAIVVVGNAPCVNGKEAEDRAGLALPPGQEALVRAVWAVCPRTVLVVESSYPYAITWADGHVPAILWTSHGGQETGRALADVLFGDHAAGGRLTQTWYRAPGDLADIRDYDIIGSRQTYLYFEGTPLYPFGHGLTYTSFRYGDLRVSPGAVSVSVTNTGDRRGDEVVQLYTRQLRSRVAQPRRQLRGFQRVHLQAGETREVRFSLRARDLAFWDVTRGRFVVEDGEHDVMVGRSSADIALTATLHVDGEVIPPRSVMGVETRASDFDDWAGMVLVDESRERGDAVAPAAARGWVAFRGADLGAGASGFSARVASAGGGGELQVRLDDPSQGCLVAVLPVPATGGRYDWQTVSVPVRDAQGVRDLYLVLSGDARLAGFAFTPA